MRKLPQREEKRRRRSVRKPPQSEDDAEAAEAGQGGLMPNGLVSYLGQLERE